MDQVSKFIRMNKLIELYGSLLSSTQKEMLTSYYSYNLSLSEIAIEKSISRAAVDDAIKKGSKKLEELETSLKLLEKQSVILEEIEKIKKSSDPTVVESAKKIEREVK